MEEVMIEVEEISVRCLMIGIEEDTFLLEAIPEVTKIQEVHVSGQITREIEVTAGYQGSEINLEPLLEDLELHQGLLVEKMTDALAVSS